MMYWSEIDYLVISVYIEIGVCIPIVKQHKPVILSTVQKYVVWNKV